MKKLFLLPVVIMLACGLLGVLILGACAAPTPTPTPTPTPSPAPSPAPGDVVNWTMFVNAAPGATFQAEAWATKIIPDLKAGTNGRLNIDALFAGEHPYTTSDLWDTINDGSCDILVFDYHTAAKTEPRLSLEFLTLLMPDADTDTKRTVHNKLRLTVLEDIFADWNAHEIATSYQGAQQLWLNEGELADYDSLKGKTIRTYSPELDNLVKMLNGTPVRLDPVEVYTSLQTGLLDGLFTGVSYSMRNSLPEVVKVMVPLAIIVPITPVVVNNDSWNALPQDLRDYILKYFEDNKEWYESGAWVEDGLLIQKAWEQYGLTVIPNPEFRKELREKAYENIWKPWIDVAGLGGAEAFNEMAKVYEAEGIKLPGYTPY